MELFSELYSCYFQVIGKILDACPVTREQMTQIIQENAFGESVLTILPKLINGEWELLEKQGESYIGKVGCVPELPLTLLQKRWLSAILQDKRMALFLTKQQADAIAAALDNPEPLYLQQDFAYSDIGRSPDNYADSVYRAHFQQIVAALGSKTLLCISYHSARQNRIEGNYLPCRLEYSQKDDKFRFYALRLPVTANKAVRLMNVERIVKMEPSSACVCEAFAQACADAPIDLDACLLLTRCDKPVQFEIFCERNALERCMLHFASYEKSTEYLPESDSYLCTVYYDKREETELLIRILSFGPVVRVLSPPAFLKQVKERVRSQQKLLQADFYTSLTF